MKKLLIAASTAFVLTSTSSLAFNTVWEHDTGNDWYECTDEAKITVQRLRELADDIGEPLDVHEFEHKPSKYYEAELEQPGGLLRYECQGGRRFKLSVTY